MARWNDAEGSIPTLKLLRGRVFWFGSIRRLPVAPDTTRSGFNDQRDWHTPIGVVEKAKDTALDGIKGKL